MMAVIIYHTFHSEKHLYLIYPGIGVSKWTNSQICLNKGRIAHLNL